MRVRETTRRLALGTFLAVAASVSVGDDVVSAPDARRGSHAVATELPDGIGAVTLHVPRTPAAGVALLLHNHEPHALTPVLDALAASTLLVPIDVARLAPGGATAPCDEVVERLALAARRAQRDAGLNTYQPAVVVGVGRASPLAHTLVASSDPGLFSGGVGTPFPRSAATAPPCTAPARERTDAPWTSAAPPDLPAAAEAALAQRAPPMTTGHLPLDRWLAYFRLPLSAAWTAQPRAVLILMSDARGLRAGDRRLAASLAAQGIPVLTIDALRYFWQRRSPRDVAYELKRLMGALQSLDVPILVGGTGFGAETMAVATRQVDDAPVAGLVLLDPGPSAFFEVEPPLPALVPLLRRDWSTADAVAALDVPTLCVASARDRARVVCRDLARTSRVTTAHLDHLAAGEPVRAATLIAEFAQGRTQPGGARRPSGGQPRKPST